ncbi:hypothetical protein AAKU55_001281 [Oxalobacteraceae bacterium GrIS 1.11]
MALSIGRAAMQYTLLVVDCDGTQADTLADKHGFRRPKWGKLEMLCACHALRDRGTGQAEGLAFGAVAWGYSTVETRQARGPEIVFAGAAELARIAGPA